MFCRTKAVYTMFVYASKRCQCLTETRVQAIFSQLAGTAVCDGAHWASVMNTFRIGPRSVAIVSGDHPSESEKGEAAKVVGAQRWASPLLGIFIFR